MNGSVVAAMGLMAVPTLTRWRWPRPVKWVIGWAHARQIEAIEQVSQQMPDFVDQTGELIDPAPAGGSRAARWSTGRPSTADLAHWLCADLPQVLDALRLAGGPAQSPRDRDRHHRTAHRGPPAAGDAIDYAARHTCACLRPALVFASHQIDPDAAAWRRKRAAVCTAGVDHPEPDGMATPRGVSNMEAQACWNALRNRRGQHRRWCRRRPRGHLVALLTGLHVGDPVPVQVIITPGRPGTPRPRARWSAEHTRDLCDRADRITLDRLGPSTGYTPAPGSARWVRDWHCRFPWLPTPRGHVRPRPRSRIRAEPPTTTTSPPHAATTTGSKPTPTGKYKCCPARCLRTSPLRPLSATPASTTPELFKPPDWRCPHPPRCCCSSTVWCRRPARRDEECPPCDHWRGSVPMPMPGGRLTVDCPRSGR